MAQERNKNSMQQLDDPEKTQHYIDAEVLGDIDAWNLRKIKDWFLFDANLPGASGPRGYRRRCMGGDYIAETPGPVLGILSLGGARRAESFSDRGKFPYHIVSSGDDIGAVGVSGVEPATKQSCAERVCEQTQDTLLAAEFLKLRQSSGRGLPLMFARAETDSAASISELSEGIAFQNLLVAIENLEALAASLEKPARIAAVSIDFAIEDVQSSAETYLNALRALVKKIEKQIWVRKLPAPTYFMIADTAVTERAMVSWELAVYGTDANLVVSIPDYVLERNAFLRLTPEAMRLRAKTEAAALFEIEAGRGWVCPSFLLAEWEGRKPEIRLRSNADRGLVIQPTASRAGENCGFEVFCGSDPVKVKSVSVDPDEPRDILLRLPGDVSRRNISVRYGLNGTGGVYDDWQHPFGEAIYRWALPVRLKVTPDGI